MDAGAEQRLARVDVADADDDSAVHHVLLDRDAPIAARAPQIVGVELVAERLGAQDPSAADACSASSSA